MGLIVGVLIVAVVIVLVSLGKLYDGGTSEGDRGQHTSVTVTVVPKELEKVLDEPKPKRKYTRRSTGSKTARVKKDTTPTPDIPYSIPEPFNFNMQGRAYGDNGQFLLPDEFVVFDLETTGFSSEKGRIIEVGAILVNRHAESHNTFHSLVKTSWRLSDEITQKTGITRDMLNASGRSRSWVIPHFLEFIGDRPLVAFNAPFDMRFLRKAASEFGLPVPNEYACALSLSRRAWPGLTSHKLPDLSTMLNLPMNDLHRGLRDSERTVQVFVQAVELLGGGVEWSS
jgi:DNA polymerase-3 subunit epsilon